MSNQLLRSLPSVDRLLARPTAERVCARLGRDTARGLLREVLEEVRNELLAGSKTPSNKPALDKLIELIERRLDSRATDYSLPSLRRVVNATGVILHTNLGRAPLPIEAVEAITSIASGYSNLEFDLTKGARGHRELHCQELIARLVGSEAAVVANNNAAAVLLVLNSLASGGEVIVSRGELIEIGGSFRLPEIMEKSGAILREVGTTNRTRISDFENAINEKTRLILRVHPSNYRIVGFTQRPTPAEIADLASRRGIPSFEDLGSGVLMDLEPYGIADEPPVSDSLKAGISVVSFSGDKMLGGPQAGVIAGARWIVEEIRKNPLMRAMRVDKLTYAALEATLRLYEAGRAASAVPVIRSIRTQPDEVADRAAALRRRLEDVARDRITAVEVQGHSVIGGGSAPEVKLPTTLVCVEVKGMSAASIDQYLRSRIVPILARTIRDRLAFDLRTVTPEEEDFIVEAVASMTTPTGKEMAVVES